MHLHSYQEFFPSTTFVSCFVHAARGYSDVQTCILKSNEVDFAGISLIHQFEKFSHDACH